MDAWISRSVSVFAFAAFAWIGFRPACPSCDLEDVRISPPEAAPIHARLYVPRHGARTDLPAVVVSHGYLSNSGFLEIPWAADLTRLGMVALFLDRRGHGRSPGDWWPRNDAGGAKLTELYPDLHAAVSHLRSLRPLVDPRRIALLGHSDGGTGAVMVASADWEVTATVSLSASVAPWEYVNHVVPKNLLLLYGTEDRFIVADTDVSLMKNATRGYLAGEGRVGSPDDGSARQLLRVGGRGHVDLIYSEQARGVALGWLAEAFGLKQDVVLSPLRRRWVVAGTVFLLLAVLFWNGLPGGHSSVEGFALASAKLAVIAALWAGGLALGAWMGSRLGGVVPVREGNAVTGLLLAQVLVMGPVALFGWVRNPPRSPFKKGGSRNPSRSPFGKGGGGSPRSPSNKEGGWRRGDSLFLGVARGAGAGLLVQVGVEAAFRSMYTTSMDGKRLALAAGFFALALPAFGSAVSAVRWVRNGQVARGVPVEVVFAALTALLAPYLFVRMSMLPVFVLALALLFTAAYRAGGHGGAEAAAFGAAMYGRAASVVCAFY